MHAALLVRINTLMDATEEDSAELAELDALADIVRNYEAKRWPLVNPMAFADYPDIRVIATSDVPRTFADDGAKIVVVVSGPFRGFLERPDKIIADAIKAAREETP